MKKFLITLSSIAVFGLLAMLVMPTFAAGSPVSVDEEPGVCDVTTVTAYVASPPATVDNMYLVVDTEDGAVQSENIPTDGTSVSLSVGPFTEDTTVYWHVFGGGERDYDIPLWNHYGEPDFGTQIVNYAASVGGSYSWVISETDDANPFVTWNELPVSGCTPVATFNGGGHLLEEMVSKRKDWLDISFGGWASLYPDNSLTGEMQVNLHNVSDDLDKSVFHGTEVTEMNLYNGDGATCNDAMNLTVNGSFNGEPGYSMIFRAGDYGSPNTLDTARVTIYNNPNGTGSVVYDTHDGDFTNESSCVGTARTRLDTGNITIWQQ
jgi:hypothetical protein